ncbi:2-amino-4-hydroxy-6-hydroxymethyldihydropteridine diphosphokinase [Agromyces aerolatus]|uniref:2-amino-4-hydroxy-6- hydroxymethyldihydropteridine diphosphokinase n=1 Tax=Agromyces sp. LY-1074 TaxID=3074080 RepID=UPI002861B621|nr:MULTISPECIES: 2-amino-4-hydroxy-6-hydroxymethyldihydropteridine diphosphokinase [unclassified Agromyces]MDR5698484.1 2-amino-4-hydroxy-6-hydroxymethyldihydropteridine diphosphokinase [Agromyces sp. LY-1074]MDR5704778.1 2-amino-4-hydroxy-6-hydroxymethyldihydropteridine diphosphokinase [Agromyces sp. LY-1358]
MSRAIIAFGANLGDREATIAEAVRELADTDGVALVAVSPVYETAAITVSGVDPDAPGYLNGVVAIETSLDPHALLERLHEIEAAHGRERTERWGARTLDLDLIDVDGRVIADDRLVLPHRRAWERAFVLQPWLDVEPDATLAGRGPISALRAAASDEVTRR